MANIITARQALRANGGANIDNCAALKHLWVPYGRRSELIDYKSGVVVANAFTAHGTHYSVASVATDTATTGDLADPGASNFGWCVTLKPVAVVGVIALGLGQGNKLVLGQFTGGAGGADATANLSCPITADVQSLVMTRSAADAINVAKNGTVAVASTTAIGAITLGNGCTIYAGTEFYGSALFVFSGDLPADYAVVMAELDARWRVGNYSLPIEIEGWE